MSKDTAMGEIFNEFDKVASNYREIHNQNLRFIGGQSEAYAIAKVEEVLKWEAETNYELKFLDIGCGDGIVENVLNKKRSNYALFGVDISEESINLASANKGTFLTYDGENLPFDKNTFDVIFIANVLHHVEPEDRLSLLVETNRVLKKGGRIYLFEHNPWNPFTRYIVKTCPFDKGVKLLSAAHSKNLLKHAGYSSQKCRYITFFPKSLNSKWLNYIENKIFFLPLGGQYYVKGVK